MRIYIERSSVICVCYVDFLHVQPLTNEMDAVTFRPVLEVRSKVSFVVLVTSVESTNNVVIL